MSFVSTSQAMWAKMESVCWRFQNESVVCLSKFRENDSNLTVPFQGFGLRPNSSPGFEFQIIHGVPKNVHAKLGIVITQVSPDSERASSHRENKPHLIEIGPASQKLCLFQCSKVSNQL